MKVGIQFVDTDGSVYDPHSDDRHAAWVERTYGPDRVAEFAELRAAFADRPAWGRYRNSGNVSHAVTVRGGHVAVVIGCPAGWGWQVYRAGGSRPLRDMGGSVASSAVEALRLADEFIDASARRRTRARFLTRR